MRLAEDERDGDGADVVEGLQVAAQGEIEHEGRGSGVERLEEADRLVEDDGVYGHTQERVGDEGDDAHEDCGEDGGEQEAVEEPAVGVVDLAGAVGLGEVGVEAEEHAADAEGRWCCR